MIEDFRRLVVVIGAFGSGKTEIALHLAHAYAHAGPSVLVDLDIVNPYFRSSAQREALEASGVRVIAPRFAMTAVDVPALRPEIDFAFEPGHRAVFDVGGDEAGAAALGRYSPRFAAEPPEVLFVVNACRPMTQTADGVMDVYARVREKGRLCPTLLVNNANLQDETNREHIQHGADVLAEVSAMTGLPVITACADDTLLTDSEKTSALVLTRRLRLAWGSEGP